MVLSMLSIGGTEAAVESVAANLHGRDAGENGDGRGALLASHHVVAVATRFRIVHAQIGQQGVQAQHADVWQGTRMERSLVLDTPGLM